MPTFLQNAWYAAGWARELGEGFLARRVLDKPVLFYRDDDGVAIAIGGTCPHRFAPLELGRRIGSSVECGYHGLRFDRDGRCILNPNGNQIVPATAHLPGYRLVERYGLLWIWMGDQSRADDSEIPNYSYLSDPEHFTTTRGGYLNVKGNYRLLCDNLMDLTHTGYLHSGTLGNDGVGKAQLQVEQSGSTVKASFVILDHPAPNALRLWIDCGDAHVDKWTDILWRPGCCITLDLGITLTGRPRSEGRGTRATHLLTPETDHTTHYFYASSRTYLIDDAAATARNEELQRTTFEKEDGPMIEAVQRNMPSNDLFAMKPASLSSDTAGIRLRRLLDELIAAESNPASYVTETV
jgi:phenylpropionate dioxygenase-like ring-hydroxylating dioxygenase large terminal subunit